jgi:hypothetical protein
VNEYDKEQFKKLAVFLHSISAPIEQKLSRTQSDIAFVWAKYIDKVTEEQ